MRTSGVWFLLILAASVLAVPVGLSQGQLENQTDNSGNQTTTNPPPTNATSIENLGQQVSAFMHQAMEQFKKQREETVNAIKECREKIRDASPETRKQVSEDCKAKLQAIREKYADDRKKFRELFTEFRDNAKVLIKEAKGMPVPEKEKEQAISNMKDIRMKEAEEKKMAKTEEKMMKEQEKPSMQQGNVTKNEEKLAEKQGKMAQKTKDRIEDLKERQKKLEEETQKRVKGQSENKGNATSGYK